MSLVTLVRGPGKPGKRSNPLPGSEPVPGPITKIVLPAAIAGIIAGSCPDPTGKRIRAVDPLAAAGSIELRGGVMAVKLNDYGDVDLEKLKYALQGLNSFYLALVWEFAEYCLRLQSAMEQLEATKKN